ncbi:MAG TPA: hypothetical protein VMD59_14195, partial [Acidimicrobiales bacterium]|nr:hypothetical protein [Acidimicrobiales bacterium]
GSFGFEASHDEISRQIAATGFSPALEASRRAGEQLVIDGFSCLTQARQLGLPVGTSLAELLLRASR